MYYSKKEAHELLGVTKVTLYKHMAKNRIKKGRKLSEEEMEILKESISKSKRVNFNKNTNNNTDEKK